MVKINEIAHAKFEDYILGIEDNSVDLIATDPPYSDGKGKDVLAGHKIQTVLDLDFIAQQHYRILKPNSFYAFFGQMPTIRAWEDAAYRAGFEWVKAIVWAKRNSGISMGKIQGVYELIFIFRKGNPKFNKTEGNYEDVSQPMTELGLKNIESAFRQIGYLKGVAEGRILKNTKSTKRQNNDNFYKITEFHKNNKPHIGQDLVDFTNIWAFKEDEYEKLTNYILFLQDFYLKNSGSSEIQCPDILSFLPHNCAHRNAKTGQIQHPTVKNIECMERLIELCSFDNATIFDGFGGSGTTYIACKRTKRNFLGCEIYEDYHKIIVDRLAKEDKIIAENLF